MPEMNPFPRPQTPAPAQTSSSPASKSQPSFIAKDLKIVGNLNTTDSIIIEGKVEGDLSARSIALKETAEFEGHIRVEEAVVDGSLKGEIRGKKIRLNKTARVMGDIIHGNIAIEAGAIFEGHVKRTEDPMGLQSQKGTAPTRQPPPPSKDLSTPDKSKGAS